MERKRRRFKMDAFIGLPGSRFGLLLLLILAALLGDASGECFTFSKENIGIISPYDVRVIAENGTLSLNCTLYDAYARNHSLSSRDILWQRGSPFPDTLHPDSNARVAISHPDRLTSTLTVRNLAVDDSAAYRCFVPGINDSIGPRPICSVDVTIAGPPVKYKNFRCESDDLRDLKCSWQRGDNYPPLGATKYTLTHHLQGETSEFPCPDMTPEPGGRPSSFYSCLWKSSAEPGAQKLAKPLERPKFMWGYTYYLTINGTNDLGSQAWHEVIAVEDYVKPAAPANLRVTQQDPHTCMLLWDLDKKHQHTPFLQSLRYLVKFKKDSLDVNDWQEREVTDSMVNLNELDASSTYKVEVRVLPRPTTGYRSEPAYATCQTKETVPEKLPGLLDGAYEELGNGAQRQATLYWKGVPARDQNGKNFLYEIRIMDSTMSEPRFLTTTNFANYVIPAPSDRATTVIITPRNFKGPGVSETVTIPAVVDHPLRIRFANVVKFDSTTYEINWATNRPARFIDLFWCPTSLSTHLAKCTTLMNHITVNGSRSNFNVTVEEGKEYRFAVSARGARGECTGMTWKGRHCSIDDREPWLDSLVVESMANASVKVVWDVPCQHRFKAGKGYRVDFYPCREEARTRCVQEKFDVVRDTSEHIVVGLLPETRYCFEVRLVDDNSTMLSLSRHGGVISKCLTTASLPPDLPPSAIIGAVFGAIVLAVVLVIVGLGIKKSRKVYKEVENDAIRINIPSSMEMPHPYVNYDKEHTHYTTIDKTDDMHYLRQLSDGIGSMESDETSGGNDPAISLPLSELQSAGDGNKMPQHNFTCSSSTDLKSVAHADEVVTDHQMPGSRSSFHGHRRPLGSSEKLHVLLPNRQSITQIPMQDSGLSGRTQASSGYVAPTSFQPSDNSANGESSGGNVTDDTGYTSHPSLSSSSGGDQLSSHEDSGVSSGFSEMDSPLAARRKAEVQPLMWKDSGINDSLNEDNYNSGDEQEEEDGDDDTSGRGSTPDSPTPATTRLLGGKNFPEKGGGKPGKMAQEGNGVIPVGNGYVAWP